MSKIFLHPLVLPLVGLTSGYFSGLFCYYLGFKLFGCYIQLSTPIIWGFWCLPIYFPFMRAKQYYKKQTIETGFALGWISVDAGASENKRKLALFFDTYFYLICTAVIVVAYFFLDKRCNVF